MAGPVFAEVVDLLVARGARWVYDDRRAALHWHLHGLLGSRPWGNHSVVVTRENDEACEDAALAFGQWCDRVRVNGVTMVPRRDRVIFVHERPDGSTSDASVRFEVASVARCRGLNPSVLLVCERDASDSLMRQVAVPLLTCNRTVSLRHLGDLRYIQLTRNACDEVGDVVCKMAEVQL